MEQFQQFWEAYPRKVNKAQARKAWNQVSLVRPDLETLLQALDKQKTQEQWQNPIYIPHAATWLRNERWEDEVYEAPKKAPVLSFAERDEMLKRQKWEEMTGRKWPEPGERRLQLL